MKKMHQLISAVAAGLLLHLGSVMAAEPMHVGTLTVTTVGDHGSPIILIPGLSCGAWVWDGTVEHLKNDHVLYVVTLAGFDGAKPVKGKLFEQADDSLEMLIESKHINKPVLIGHSLGGTLSFKFAEHHSKLISGMIAIDGMPILPGLQTMTPEQRTSVVEDLRKKMAKRSQEEFEKGQVDYMKSVGVIDPKKAEEVAAELSKSDVNATAQYMAEDMKMDLRPKLGSIEVPVLEICPHNAADSGGMYYMTQDQKSDLYKSLLKGTPNLEVVVIPNSRHFVMYDQPDAMYKAIDDFLSKK